MSQAQQVNDQVKRAKCSLETFLGYVKRQGVEIDVALEAEKIRLHLNDPKTARTRGSISPKVVALATYLRGVQRPHELFRSA